MYLNYHASLYRLGLGLRGIEREESQFSLTKKTDHLEIFGSMGKVQVYLIF